MAEEATNTLNCEVKCPHCGKTVSAEIGFRVGAITRGNYRLGERLSWTGSKLRPQQRPDGGNLKTIGYFECDNLSCTTWQDCYPEVQEVLIVVKEDILSEAKPFIHKPNTLIFDIIEPNE